MRAGYASRLAGVAVRFCPRYASQVLAPLSYPSREPLLLITSLNCLRSRYDNERRRRRDDDEEDDSDDERRRRERHRRQRDAESDDGGNALMGLSRRSREGNHGGGAGYGDDGKGSRGYGGGRGGGGYGAPTGPAADDRGPCWDFQRGRCTRGGACRFSHALDGPGGGGGGGGYGKGEYAHSGGYGKG